MEDIDKLELTQEDKLWRLRTLRLIVETIKDGMMKEFRANES